MAARATAGLPVKFLPIIGGAISTGAGFAVGAATAPTLRPILRDLENRTWAAHPVVPPSAGTLATGVSQGQVDLDVAAAWAKQNGFGDAAFAAMVAVANVGPGVARAFDLWRRGILKEEGFRRAAKRDGLEGEWIDDLVKIFYNLLDPVQVAAGIHRGLIPDPGLLKGVARPGAGQVESYPLYPIDALAEVLGGGLDKDRLGVLVGLQGLPMSVEQAAQAEFRGLLDHNDVLRAGAEGNTRNEWVEKIYELSRQIPTARDFIENALRGYRTLAEAQQGAALHGMSAEHARLIFQNSGRPLNLHQITQALAWGGKYQPAAGDNPDPWRQAVLIGAVRPEYYDLQESLKYNLPSAFYFRALQQQGVLTVDEATTWYKRLGWPPDLAQKVAVAYGKGTGAASDPHVAKAATQLWTTQHTAYKNDESSEAEARTTFDVLDIPADAQQQILTYWNREKAITRKQLTPTQLKKAFGQADVNPATGAPWTQDEVIEELIGRGYSHNDAVTFLGL